MSLSTWTFLSRNKTKISVRKRILFPKNWEAHKKINGKVDWTEIKLKFTSTHKIPQPVNFPGKFPLVFFTRENTQKRKEKERRKKISRKVIIFFLVKIRFSHFPSFYHFSYDFSRARDHKKRTNESLQNFPFLLIYVFFSLLLFSPHIFFLTVANMCVNCQPA